MKQLFLVFLILCFLNGLSQNYLPIGYLDYVDTNGGYGWAYDADAGTNPIDVHIYIDGRFYMAVTANQERPDLVAANIAPDPYHGFSFVFSGIDINLRHEITVYAINYGGGPNPTLSNTPNFFGTYYSGDASISNQAGPSQITITTTNRLAGAIHSLTWNGVEFIDSYDHGRQLQSATSYNNWGECFNPTEAGCAQDDTGPTSTSLLMYQYAEGNYMETQTLPAYWTQPGHVSPQCGTTLNTTPRSSHYFRKKITIGMPGIQHVIKYYTEFEIPESDYFESGVFEVLTGYMPSDFSEFYTYNPATQVLTPLSDTPGEQSLPIIFSKPNHLYAMGIYSPDLPQPNWNWVGYGRFRFPSCVKWNSVFREAPVTHGIYKYRCFVIVGSLDNVKVSMNQLFNYFKPTANFDATSVCIGNPTIFTDLSTGITEESLYFWDINNDGSIDYTTQGNFSHTFDVPGTYQVKLRIVNGVAPQHQSEIVKNIQVFENPTANIELEENEICQGESIDLVAYPSGGTFSGTGVSGNIFNSQGLTQGQYVINYIYTDQNQCSASDIAYINVLDCTNSYFNDKLSISFNNPVNKNLIINNLNENSEIIISDISGKILFKTISKSSQEILDLTNLNNGLYSLKINQNQNSKNFKILIIND